MTDVNQDLREYQTMKKWLAGEQPPAAGRTWRRTLHAKAEAVLPLPVMQGVDTVIRWTPDISGIRLAVLGMGGAMFLMGGKALMSSPLGADSPNDMGVVVLVHSVEATIAVMEPIAAFLSALAIGVGAWCVAVNGR